MESNLNINNSGSLNTRKISNGMKVLMISTDIKILDTESAVRARMVDYGNLFEELHIVLFSGKGVGDNQKIKIGDRVIVYPTNSSSKIARISNAIKIGSTILNDFKSKGGESIITTQDPFETGIVGKTLKKRFGFKLNVQIHTDFLSPFFSKASFVNRVRVFISGSVLREADSIRVVSSKIKESLVQNSKFKILDSKISILPIFIDIEAIKNARITTNLKSKYPQFEKIVLMASRFTFEKDILTAVRAFSVVLSTKPKIGLVIVGSGPELEKIRSFVVTLGIKDKVVCEPWVARDTLISYMKTSDVFVSTSLYEGYGMSMVEAVAAGLPLVATDAGVAKDIASVVVTPGDELAISDGILRVLSGSIQALKEHEIISKQEYLKKYSDILSA